MKIGWKEFGFTVAGFIIAFLVQEYAIQRHELIKKAEKDTLRQKIERENQILTRRLEEDFAAFKESVTVAYAKEKRQYAREHGLSSPGSSGIKNAVEARLDAERDRILAEKRKQIDRKIEDLEMRVDF
jgi:hypothetical protein